MDKNSLIKGLQVGSLITGMRRVQKVPIAYLYNGVQLPELPETDLPYAVIYSSDSHYVLTVLSVKPTPNALTGMIQYESANRIIFKCEGGNEWVKEAEGVGNGGILYSELVWANYDVLKSGEVYLPASDPIPVYE